jgi:hypothetical protein
MYINQEFWTFFNDKAAPKLVLRERTFRKIFEYLDAFAGPITIVETGCARLADNWAGDGQSTVLFDKYICGRDRQSECYSVDINPVSVSACKQLVSSRVNVTQDDSVHYLNVLVRKFSQTERRISFLYLDSFDLDKTYWYPSAIHHLKELTAVMRCIDEKTLVVVDDCPLNADFVPGEGNQISFVGPAAVGGKGRLVAEYAAAAGARTFFAEYQAGWVGF